MNENEPVGKRLGLAAQEMGREINTTGSKSNLVGLQSTMAKMKDELEQIKEQVFDALQTVGKGSPPQPLRKRGAVRKRGRKCR